MPGAGLNREIIIDKARKDTSARLMIVEPCTLMFSIFVFEQRTNAHLNFRGIVLRQRTRFVARTL